MMVYTRLMAMEAYEGDDEVYFVEPDPVPVEDEDAIEIMWAERALKPFRPTPAHPFRAARCTGTVRNGPRTGKRCGREATLGTNVCVKHGAQLTVVKQAAAQRVNEITLAMVNATPMAANVLIELAESADSGAVRLKAATEILDRAGVRGGTDINVTVEQVDTAASIVRERLEQLRKRTIEGEIVADEIEKAHNPEVEDVTVDSVDNGASDDAHPAEEN